MTTLANLCDKVIKFCLYALIFFLPIFYLPWTFEALEFNKQNLLIILTLIAAVAWLGKMAASKQIIWRKSFFNLLALFYLAIYAISSLFASDKFRSLAGSSGMEKEGLITVFCLILFYLVIANNIEKTEKIKNYIYTFLFGSFLTSVFSLLGLLNLLPSQISPNWTGNTIGSLTALAIFLSLNFILTSTLLFKTYSSFQPENTAVATLAKIFLASASVFNLLLLVLIDAKMSWVCLIIGAAVSLTFIVVKAPEIKNLSWSIFPVAAIIIAVFLFFFKTPLNLNLPAEITLSFSSSAQTAEQTLGKNPFFGSGPGTFSFDYARYKPLEVNKTPLWNIKFDQSSSQLFTLLATTGLFGILSWIFLVLFLAVKSLGNLIKEKNGDFWPTQLALIASWLSLLAAKLLYSPTLTLEFSFWLLSGLIVASISHKFWEASLKQDPRASLILSFFLSLGIIFSISIFYLIGQRYSADFAFRQAIILSEKGEDIEKVRNYFDIATTKNGWNDLYYKNLAQSLLLNINKELNLEVTETRSKQIQALTASSINAAKKAVALSPENSTNWNVLASTYQNVIPIISGADKWAIGSWQKTIELEPNNPSFYNELGKVYVIIADLILSNAGEQPKKEIQTAVRENLAKAEEQFNKAIELKNDFVPAHFQLSLVYGKQGRIKEAISKLESMRYSLPSDIGISFQLGLLYYQDKEADKAIAELKRTLELAPKFANAHWYLAAIYEEQGENDLAIKELKEILKEDSENKTVKDRIEMLENQIVKESTPLPTPLPEAGGGE